MTDWWSKDFCFQTQGLLEDVLSYLKELLLVLSLKGRLLIFVIKVVYLLYKTIYP